jgi:hypothetical protein
MDSEHRNLMIKTLSLINHTRHEISQLRDAAPVLRKS